MPHWKPLSVARYNWGGLPLFRARLNVCNGSKADFSLVLGLGREVCDYCAAKLDRRLGGGHNFQAVPTRRNHEAELARRHEPREKALFLPLVTLYLERREGRTLFF